MAQIKAVFAQWTCSQCLRVTAWDGLLAMHTAKACASFASTCLGATGAHIFARRHFRLGGAASVRPLNQKPGELNNARERKQVGNHSPCSSAVCTDSSPPTSIRF